MVEVLRWPVAKTASCVSPMKLSLVNLLRHHIVVGAVKKASKIHLLLLSLLRASGRIPDRSVTNSPSANLLEE